MIIEIRKAGFVNKGAELMLHAALRRLQKEFPHAMFAMAPAFSGGGMNPYDGYAKRAELGFLQKAWLWRYGFQWGRLAAMVPGRLRKGYGVVLDREIDVIIDAAGFSYGDQWGSRSSLELARSSRRWRKRGTKVILLPQALGPFTSHQIKNAIEIAVDNVDLIFAREPVSYEHLVAVVGERPNVKMAPDFTNLLDGILPDHFDAQAHRFCIVPNFQMTAKTNREESEAYLPFMIRCTKYLQDRGMAPFVLIHEGAKDLALGEGIREAVGDDLPVVTESDPLKIKGILGSCEGSIGSRFHGLVSALSQGVPALGTGWSHKYQMLFADYGFSEGLLDCLADEQEMQRKLDLIIEPESRQQIQATLLEKSELQKQRSEQMWQEVLGVIRSDR